jgi:uncharacterized small protein (DUF1192 family)
MSDFGTNLYADDELAAQHEGLKDGIRALREELWKVEAELARRLASRQARTILGKEFKVRTSNKREIVWDQFKLGDARYTAVDNGLEDLFDKSFPLKRECSVRNLNELLKLGGKTAEAIEAAKLEVKERQEFIVERL